MTTARLEHVNITVSDPYKTAKMLEDIFDWYIRWEGASMDNGHTIHIGTDEDYIALYANGQHRPSQETSYVHHGGLNHIALVVDDLEAIEKRVLDAGYKTENHGDYDPGRRFYFHDHDNIEYEIVSYGDKS